MYPEKAHHSLSKSYFPTPFSNFTPNQTPPEHTNPSSSSQYIPSRFTTHSVPQRSLDLPKITATICTYTPAPRARTACSSHIVRLSLSRTRCETVLHPPRFPAHAIAFQSMPSGHLCFLGFFLEYSSLYPRAFGFTIIAGKR